MGLPRSILAKIWKLSDQGQDGKLDRYEFSIYHHLTRRAYYYGDEIPDQVVISPHSHDSIIILYIAASPSTLQRIPGQHQQLEGAQNSISRSPTNPSNV